MFLFGAGRSPRPAICRNRPICFVGLAKTMQPIAGRSKPSVSTMQLQTTSVSPASRDNIASRSGFGVAYYYTTEDKGLVVHRYVTNACRHCAIKHSCTKGKERRISRWEHEHIIDAVQRRLDEHPEKMRQRRETVEHPFGTIKARMGATHFLMKTLPRVASEMALHVLAYNLTRVMNIMGVQPLMAAMRA